MNGFSPRLAVADIHCNAEIREYGLTPDLRCSVLEWLLWAAKV